MTAQTSTVDLLSELARSGVRLKLVNGSDLQVMSRPGGLSADVRARISGHKAELIAWLTTTRADAEGTDEPLTITPDPRALHDPFPPSDLQTAFLMGSQVGLEYHVRPHGYTEFNDDDLDPDRFIEAWNRAVRRHRNSIVVVREDLQLQTVRELTPVPVTVHDLRGWNEAATDAALRGIREASRRREPEHHRWPWMDVALTRYGDGRSRLHLNNNTFFIDAPGSMRLLHDALHFYHHPEQDLPELSLAYRDCVLALADIERSPRGIAAREYWTHRIPDLPGPPEVPMSAGLAHRGRSRLSRRDTLFPADVWRDLKAAAAARGLTTTSVLLTAHAEILAYWSGSRHFLLNNMITHRQPLHPEITEILGNFAALYPLEVDLRPDEPFTDRVRRLQTQVMTDIDHVYYSGVKVLQQLSTARRTPGRAVAPFAVGSALFIGSIERPDYSMLETPQTVLDTEFWELRDGRLWVIWDVIEAAFPAGLINAMSAAYGHLLHDLAADKSAWQRHSFDLLPADQRRGRAIGNAPVGTLRGGLLHDPLAAHAAHRPTQPAVITASGVLDYRTLDLRAAGVAAELRARGTRQGDLVAIVTPKDWPQIAAAIGALEAGTTYVPIDPGWPDDRVRYLLTDTAATAVLTVGKLADRLRAITAVPVISVDDLGDGVPRTTDDGTDRRPADQPAYVIYTSGSTGRPKGAILNHQGPLNTIADINERFRITGNDVLFGVSSLSFDLSVYDIFGALDAGAALVLPATTDPSDWIEPVLRHGVSVWNSVPALMQLFVEAAVATGATFPQLRIVLLSGDWIPVHLPDRIREVAPNAQVISLGGATEASIWSIVYPIDDVDPAWTSIPYGRPLRNQTWYILDEHGRDAPTWVPGRLHIGGQGLAHGYLHDPDKTAAAFVAHPITGERLYYTGDLGRYLPDGDIEFLGRADFQVKIQGYRVEPGEIEQVLLEHSDVRDAAVVARSTGSGRQLVASVVSAASASSPQPAELRRFLADRLPAYLVPAQITVLDRLPLSANGKVDRTALERLHVAEASGPRVHRPATTTTEAAIVEVWEQVLDVRPIGIDDNFFDLGGQSFAALRLIGLIDQRLGVRIPLGTMLEHPTIAALADHVSADATPWSPLVRLRTGGSATEPWYFVHPAGGNVLCYRALADALDAPFTAFQAPGPANGHEPPETVTAFAARYVDALLSTDPRPSYQLGGWSSGAVIAAEMAVILEKRGLRVDRLVVVDAPAPLIDHRITDADVVAWFLEDLDVGISAAEMAAVPRTVPSAARLAALIRPHANLADTDIEATFAVFRNVVTATNRYIGTPCTADITVIRATDGAVAEFDNHPHRDAAHWGWTAMTSGSVTAAAVTGTHHTLLSPERAAQVAAAITAHRSKPTGL